MPSPTFADRYPLAVAYMSSYGLSRSRRVAVYGPPPPPNMQLPRPLASVRLMLQRLHQPPEVLAALWWYYIGRKPIQDISTAMHYTQRHIYRLLAEGLNALESLLSRDISATSDMLLPGETAIEDQLLPGPAVVDSDRPPWS